MGCLYFDFLTVSLPNEFMNPFLFSEFSIQIEIHNTEVRLKFSVTNNLVGSMRKHVDCLTFSKYKSS